MITTPGAFSPFLPPGPVAWPVRVDPDGRSGPTPQQARSRRWRRSSYGWYVEATVDATPVEQRILESAVRVVGTQGAVTGWAALRWRGAAYFDGTGAGGGPERIRLLRPGGGASRPDPLVEWSADQHAPSEIEVVRDVPCTSAVRALFDVVRYAARLWRAVIAIDMTSAAGLTTVAEFAAYVDRRHAWTGVPQARRAVSLASDESRSPQESRLRLVWTQVAGLPTPLCNRPVFDRAGRLLGYPDLLDEEAGLVVEYDGADHLREDRRQRDLRRIEGMRDVGLECVTIVGGDLRSPTAVADRLLAARRRARFVSASERAWTLEPPSWWEERPRSA